MDEVNMEHLMNELAWRASDKLCPMKMVAGEKGICEGSKCAWWNPYYAECAVGSDYRSLDYIGQAIAMLGQQIRARSEDA